MMLRTLESLVPSRPVMLRAGAAASLYNHGGGWVKQGGSVALYSTAGAAASAASIALAGPYLLPALGFGASGVAKGSLAAYLMTPHTAAGSLYAAAQSAGALSSISQPLIWAGAAVGGCAGGGISLARKGVAALRARSKL